jgi:hypothetical protein
MTNQQSSQNIILLTVLSSVIMFFNFFFSIITGPQIAHFINICALLFAFTAIWILMKNRLFNRKRPIVYIIVNLSLGLLAANFKYGYTGWHYVNLFTVVRPN